MQDFFFHNRNLCYTLHDLSWIVAIFCELEKVPEHSKKPPVPASARWHKNAHIDTELVIMSSMGNWVIDMIAVTRCRLASTRLYCLNALINLRGRFSLHPTREAPIYLFYFLFIYFFDIYIIKYAL